MASIFKKQTTRPVPSGLEIFNKDGGTFARIKKGTKGKTKIVPVTTGEDGSPRIVTESATWYAKFRDAAGVVRVVATGCRDKQAAEHKLRELTNQAERVKVGIIRPEEFEQARFADSPLEPFIAEYESHLIADEVSTMYRKNVLGGLRRVVADCKFQWLKDLNANPIVNWLADQVRAGMSARARNHYRDSLIVFGNWCVDHKKCLAVNPFTRLPKADRKADPRRPSRALTDDELQRLLKVACERPLNEALTIRRGKRRGELGAKIGDDARERLTAEGRERALIYKTLVLTGLRKNELASLTVGQFHHETGKSFITLKPKDEKNGQGSRIELMDGLADELREHCKGQPASTRLLNVPTGLLRILDRDLKAAGIPKVDDRGLCVHVHAMRKTTCTMLNKAGVPARVAQKIMRHSDIKLTMTVYTDEGQLDVRNALDQMPAVNIPELGTRTKIVSQTQTDARPNLVAPTVAPTAFNSGQNESSSVIGERMLVFENLKERIDGSASPVNKNTPLTSCDISGAQIELTGFEPATSWSRTKRSTKLSYSSLNRGGILMGSPRKSTAPFRACSIRTRSGRKGSLSEGLSSVMTGEFSFGPAGRFNRRGVSGALGSDPKRPGFAQNHEGDMRFSGGF